MKKTVIVLLLFFSCFCYSQHNHISFRKLSNVEFSNNSMLNRLDSLKKTTPPTESLLKETNFWDLIKNRKDSSIIIYEDNRKFKHTYEYKVDGRRIETTTRKWSNEKWEEHGKWIEEFDTAGINIRSTSLDWYGSEWKFRNRYTEAYDSFGNILLSLQESYSFGDWHFQSKGVREYNKDNNLVIDHYYEWENGEWVFFSGYTNEYLPNGKIALELFESSYGTKDRSIYTYDQTGRIKEIINEDWSNGILIEKTKSNYQYDFNNYSELETRVYWENGMWVNQSRSLIKKNNSIHETIIEKWISGNWEKDKLYFAGLDEIGNWISYIRKEWVNNDWVNDFRELSTYNDNRKRIRSISEKWINDKWIFRNSFTQKFNSNDKLINRSINGYSEDKKFYYNWESKYKYNTSDDLIFELSRSWHEDTLMSFTSSDIQFDNKGREIIDIRDEWNLDGYKFGWKYYTYYSDASIKFIRDDQLKKPDYKLDQNYPNPFNPTTIISFSNTKQSNIKITVYNSVGEKIETLVNKEFPQGFHFVQFIIDNLASGLYFYRLEADGFAETKKMIILK